MPWELLQNWSTKVILSWPPCAGDRMLPCLEYTATLGLGSPTCCLECSWFKVLGRVSDQKVLGHVQGTITIPWYARVTQPLPWWKQDHQTHQWWTQRQQHGSAAKLPEENGQRRLQHYIYFVTFPELLQMRTKQSKSQFLSSLPIMTSLPLSCSLRIAYTKSPFAAKLYFYWHNQDISS